MMDWKRFEAVLLKESEAAFRRWLTENPGQTAYALAFHESYRELDGQITLPQLAVNSLQAAQENQATQEIELLWNPADWPWRNLLALEQEPLSQQEADLNLEANRSTQKHWLRTERRLLSILVPRSDVPLEGRP
jgi:hypothetical protein